MLLVSHYKVVNHGQPLDLALPFTVEVTPGLTFSLTNEEDYFHLVARRRVDSEQLEYVERPTTSSNRPPDAYVDAPSLRLKLARPTNAPTCRDLVSVLSFLTDAPLTLTSHRLCDRFEPETNRNGRGSSSGGRIAPTWSCPLAFSRGHSLHRLHRNSSRL